MPLVTQARVYEDASTTLMARVEDRPQGYLTPGAPLVTSAIASIGLRIRDVAAGAIVPGFDGAPLTPSSVWFDTLQAWARDNRGHNFRYTIGPGAFPNSSTEYRVEVQINLVDGRVGFAVFDVTTELTG